MAFTLKPELNLTGSSNPVSKSIVSPTFGNIDPLSAASIATAEKSDVNLIHILLQVISPPSPPYFTPEDFGISISELKFHHTVSLVWI